MPDNLTQILERLRNDPTMVIQLYEVLYHSNFIVLVRPDTEQNINSMEFLTYPTEDGIKELPVFTKKEFLLSFQTLNPIQIEVKGHFLWPRLLQIIEPGKCEVAVNPGQSHGIRLNNSMILGMISKYGDNITE